MVLLTINGLRKHGSPDDTTNGLRLARDTGMFNEE